MNPIAYDMMTYIKGLIPGIEAFDQIRSANREMGCLIEESDNSIDVIWGIETATVTISVRDNGMGQRGTAKAHEVAQALSERLRLVLDTDINSTHYDRIMATSAPREVWGGADSSIWRFTLSVERQTN